MAKKPLQHKIDDAAKLIFKSIFNEISWNVELQPDYGIDFRVQLLDPHNNISPDVFLAQLKGHEECKWIRKKHWKGFSQPLSVERLIDYIEAYKEPVYLVVIDTTNKLARYVFMQNYSDSGLLSSDWRSQETVNIFVPAENDLKNQSKFRKDLDAATQYLCNKHPGTPNAAIQYANKRYKEIDPRFNVSWISSGDAVSQHFHPKEPINISLKFIPKGTDGNERVQRLLNEGLPTEFSSGEVQLEGSPLFDQFCKADKLIVQIGKIHEIFISLKRLNNEGLEIGRINGLKGQLTVGQKQYHFSVELPGGLISLKANHAPQEKTPSTFTFSFKVNKWIGLPVRQLPFFEDIISVFGDPNPAEICFDIIPSETGMVQACATSNINPELLVNLAGSLRLTKRMRKIAKLLEIQPRLKKSLTNADIQEIARVYHILTEGKLVRDCPKATIQFSSSKIDILRMMGESGTKPLTVTNDLHIEFFTDPIVKGRQTSHFSNVGIHNREKLIAQLSKAKDTDMMKIQMDCSEDCTLTETIEVGDSKLILK